jgi:hypothetical protein
MEDTRREMNKQITFLITYASDFYEKLMQKSKSEYLKDKSHNVCNFVAFKSHFFHVRTFILRLFQGISPQDCFRPAGQVICYTDSS